MIAFLEGEIVEEHEEYVVVSTHGVGYQLFCSSNTLDDFFGQKRIKSWVFTSVKEDSITLYGFSTKVEKQVFESLLKVNGVGPKMAMKILSGARIEQITAMIEAADAAGLSKLPKVGKKTAEQIILTLKGKLQVIGSVTATPGKPSKVKDQVLSALINLGFKQNDVETALAELSPDISFEDGVREGLAMLSGAK